MMTGSIDDFFDGNDTNCLLFMLAGIHALDDGGQKDWQRLLARKLKHKAQGVNPAYKKFRSGLITLASGLGKRKRELEAPDEDPDEDSDE